MLHVSLYSDVNVGAKPYLHPDGEYHATVHLDFTIPGAVTHAGYAEITIEQADKLADDLKAAAENARKLEAERVAKAEGRP